MLLLILSLVILFLGPLLSYWLRERKTVLSWIDRITFISIAAVLGLHTIPEAVEEAGWAVLGLVFAGFALPLIVEKTLHKAAETVHLLTLVVGVSGLVVHAILDGLSLTDHAAVLSHGTLPAVVLLHRIPVGQLIWSLIRPNFGIITTVLVLMAVAAATVAGFMLGHKVQYLLHGVLFSLFQALVAGALLHVVMFRNHIHHHDTEGEHKH